MRSISPGWFRPVQLLAWAQAWAATCGSQHSCLVEGQPKPSRWGGGRWPVGRPVHSGMGWKNTWFHSVDPPQKVKEFVCWQQPDGLALTETEKPTFLKTYPKPTQESFCSSCVEIGQWGHLACLEMVWGAVRQEHALWFKTGHFRGGESFSCIWPLIATADTIHPWISLIIIFLLFPWTLTTCLETTLGPHV